MDLAGDWMHSSHNMELLVDLTGFLILFLLIFLLQSQQAAFTQTPYRRPQIIAVHLFQENSECNAAHCIGHHVYQHFWAMVVRRN